MKKIIWMSLAAGILFYQINVSAQELYGEKFCNKPDYHCIKVASGDTWEKLWPDDEQRDIVRRINRMNIRLRAGMVIAVPNNLEELTIYDVAPFPRYVDPPGERTIIVSQDELAWGAYTSDGELLWWGPVSTGKGNCKDVAYCGTPGGSYHIIRKQGPSCVSIAFPARRNGRSGGAPMPYCMHYFRGYALHGFPIVPGTRASHGCIRMFVEDAKWLNTQFISLPKHGKGGTRVIVQGVA